MGKFCLFKKCMVGFEARKRKAIMINDVANDVMFVSKQSKIPFQLAFMTDFARLMRMSVLSIPRSHSSSAMGSGFRYRLLVRPRMCHSRFLVPTKKSEPGRAFPSNLFLSNSPESSQAIKPLGIFFGELCLC